MGRVLARAVALTKKTAMRRRILCGGGGGGGMSAVVNLGISSGREAGGRN
jgi:hypothetical protein